MHRLKQLQWRKCLEICLLSINNPQQPNSAPEQQVAQASDGASSTPAQTPTFTSATTGEVSAKSSEAEASDEENFGTHLS
jgi:hypothetical protein